jgi:glycerophosphoryl diester phosphodiesterase
MTYLGEEGLRARLTSVTRGLGLFRPRDEGPRLPRKLLVVGHRGSPRSEAENTLASFQKAVAEGADAIEADVCVTEDGEFLLWHDADPDEPVALARQLGGERLLFRPDVPPPGDPDRRPVREQTAAAFRTRHRYVRSGAEGGETAEVVPVAALSDLLAWAPQDDRLTDVILDVKLPPDETRAAGALVALLKRAEAAGGLEGVTVRLLSPQAEIVAALRDAAGTSGSGGAIRVSADFELPGAPELAPGTGVRDVSLGLGRRLWPGFRSDVARCAQARQRGVFDAVIAWTIQGADRLREVAALGVDGILTDEVPALRRIAGPRPPRRFVPWAPAVRRTQTGLGRK